MTNQNSPFPDVSWSQITPILKRVILIAAILAIPLLAFLYWWFHPPISIYSESTWGFFLALIMLPLWLFLKSRALLLKKQPSSRPSRPKVLDDKGRLRATNIDTDSTKKIERQTKLYDMLSNIPLSAVGIFLLGMLLSATFFPGNAARYANILVVQDRDFSTDIKEINYSEIPVIDKDSATLLGNRVMGEIPEYVSQFDISPLYSQINYQGRPVRVSPLGYADIFKWWNNRSNGLPAYVLVDTASQDARIVRLDAPIRYSESEPLWRNIHRHVQFKYPFYIFDQKSFEIDEDGNPWWVCPVQTRRIGLFGGTDIVRVVLCNASTGECQDIPIDDCPEWVDRVYPSDLLIEQYNWHGAYQKGWLNSIFGQEGVVQTTPGNNGQPGYNYIAKDDDVWVYSGITSATSDNSIVGFVLINQRTADARFFQISGATEVSAMHSAEGQVQHLRYHSTFPLLVNINGQPTYFMALKDDAGLVKMYAMLDIQRYQNVAVGDTVALCQTNYLILLHQSGVLTDPPLTNLPGSPDVIVETISGRVVRIATAVISGNSHFYLTLEGDPAIYDCALPALLDVLQIESGDVVTLSYQEIDGIRIVQRIEIARPLPLETIPKP